MRQHLHAVLISLFFAAAVAAEEPAKSAELAELNRIVGTWDVQAHQILPKDERVSATSTVEWALKGRVVQAKASGDTGIDTLTIWTYDVFKKKYHMSYFSSKGLVMQYEGEWNPVEQEFAFKTEAYGPKTSLVAKFKDNDSIQWKFTATDPKGVLLGNVESTWTRRK